MRRRNQPVTGYRRSSRNYGRPRSICAGRSSQPNISAMFCRSSSFGFCRCDTRSAGRNWKSATQKASGSASVGAASWIFLGECAPSEGKRGRDYFAPSSMVRMLVAMLEPFSGVVFDPCCGSGGMFVQSDLFTKHSGHLTFYGQESKDFTYRLCRMNLFIHGVDGKIELGNSYWNDLHAGVKADFILANPPFNDGS